VFGASTSIVCFFFGAKTHVSLVFLDELYSKVEELIKIIAAICGFVWFIA
jgi:hypothetical protein